MIDRVFITVLLLSISGVVFCAIFLPFQGFAYRHTSAKTMVAINTAALLSFVLPFYLFTAIFIDHSEEAFQNWKLIVCKGESPFQDAVASIRELAFMEYLSRLWLLGAAIYLLCHLAGYLRMWRAIRAGWFRLDDDAWGACFERLKAENNLSGVELVGCNGIGTPCTAGLRKRYVIIPTALVAALDEEEAAFILAHECFHIVHKDLPRRFLLLLLGAANWFNPLFRFLVENLAAWQEIACDYEVTKGFTREQNSKYCHLVVKVLEQVQEGVPVAKKRYRIGFDGSSYLYHQKRLDSVLHKRPSGPAWWKAAAAALTMSALAFGNAVAKEVDAPVNQIFSPNVVVVEPGQYQITSREKMEGYEASLKADMALFPGRYADGAFVEADLQGTPYEIIYAGTDAAPEETGHPHAMAEILLKSHERRADGSCESVYYYGRECASCGLAQQGNLIGTVQTMKCQH